MTQTVAIVQARMGSSRLPGKVLLPLGGRPALACVYERLARARGVDVVVIATTHQAGDEPIVRFCRDAGIEVYAHDGPVDDLLGRYIACGRRYDADIVVMVDGDCPLLHPPTVERMVAALRDDPEAEYCRLDPRSIEGGVAVLRLATYERMRALARDQAHREHATLFLMEHPELFTIVEVPCEDVFRDVKHRLWLDTPADYRFLTGVYDRLGRDGRLPDLRDVVGLLRAEPALAALNAHVGQKDVRAGSASLRLASSRLDGAATARAVRLAAALVERFHAGVTVEPQGLADEGRRAWQEAGFVLGGGAGPRLDLDPAVRGVRPRAPSRAGEARLDVEPGEDTDALAAWVAAYVGLRPSARGHFEATLRSSQDGRHLEARPCGLCSSSRQEVLWTHPGGVQSGLCLDCGHVHLVRCLPAPVIDESYRAFAQAVPEAALEARDGDVARLARARAALVLPRLTAPLQSVLEIGSGYGHFLAACEGAATRVGIEPSQVQAVFARRHFGLAEIWASTYEAFDRPPPTWPREGFDLVCSFHVLEHVADPRRMLTFARRVIAPSGSLCVAVPDLATLSPDLIELHFLARCWHLHTFSTRTLTRLLAETGFEVVEAVAEEPIAMLRSSLFVHARPTTPRSAPPVTPAQVEEARAHALAFHGALDARLAGLRRRFAAWRAAGRRVAVYGGGIHTTALLDLAGVDPVALTCIVDDDPAKQGSRLEGVAITDLAGALARGVDVVVASSLAAEDAILARLATMLPPGVRAVGVYRDLMRSAEGSEA